MTNYIDIVMDEAPGPLSNFVEVEDSHGKSINVGEWINRLDGYWALRLSVAVTNQPILQPPTTVTVTRDPDSPYQKYRCKMCGATGYLDVWGHCKPCVDGMERTKGD